MTAPEASDDRVLFDVDRDRRIATITLNNPKQRNSYDASISYGGPLKRDRLWFFGSYRSLNTASAVQGVVANKNAYDASRWDWVADPSVTARQLQGRTSYVGRLTAQVSSKHRLSLNDEYQVRCEGSPLKLDVDGCNKREAGWIAAGTPA